MGTEIERKFLVNGDGWRGQAPGMLLRQGYLCSAKNRVVRVRIAGDDKAWLTIKGSNAGAIRTEFEYAIPRNEAEYMLDHLAERPLIEKVRHKIPAGALVWEIDEFTGDNAGLILAEIELPFEDAPFEKPGWLGREVTGDPRYYNSSLVLNPFRDWPEAGQNC